MKEKIMFLIGVTCFLMIGSVLSTAISVRGISNSIGCSFNNKTCAPVGCTYVTNAACTPNKNITNEQIIAQISNTNCNSTCTTSKNALCSASSLNSILSKGINGANSIKAAYCTDIYLVVQSNGMPNHNDSLAYVPRPVVWIFTFYFNKNNNTNAENFLKPGGGGTSSYSTQCVTRSHVIQSFTWRIPLNPVALSTSDPTINNVAVLNALGIKLPTAALPLEGPTGMTITGLPIFPPYNNVGDLTWLSCEMDWCNTHAGQGKLFSNVFS